jgi:hypothetical protein
MANVLTSIASPSNSPRGVVDKHSLWACGRWIIVLDQSLLLPQKLTEQRRRGSRGDSLLLGLRVSPRSLSVIDFSEITGRVRMMDPYHYTTGTIVSALQRLYWVNEGTTYHIDRILDPKSASRDRKLCGCITATTRVSIKL